MSDPVFLDTVGLLALLNRDDAYHDRAQDLFIGFGRSRRHLVVSNLILAETANGLARTANRRKAGMFLRRIHHEPVVSVIYVDKDLFLQGLVQYESYDDKDWGVVDCISFQLMRDMQIQEAFTADRHFEQAGFRCLLSAPS